MTHTEIIEYKKFLLKSLAENIFSEFTKEDDLYLHSKHGYLEITSTITSETFKGKIAAFRIGLPIQFEDGTIVGQVENIDWNTNTITIEENDDDWSFKFTPYNLNIM